MSESLKSEEKNMTEKKEKKNIKAKLQEARVRLQQTSLQKSGENSFAKFKYYELKDFMPAVNGIFNELGICSNFSIDNSVATLEIMDADDDESIRFTSPVTNVELKGCTAIQGIGAMHTYMKRYLYLNALEIVENDILDASVNSNESGGGTNVVYFGQLKKEINSKSNLEALEQYIETEAENIKSRLDERQKVDLRKCVSARRSQLSPMAMA